MERLKMQYRILTLGFFVVFLILPLCLSGCVTSAKHSGLRNAKLPELIPRKDFFKYDDIRYNYQVSPDGKQIAWLAEHRGNITIFAKTLGRENISIVDTQSFCNIAWYRWAQDNRHLIYILDVGPKRPAHLYQSDLHHPEVGPIDLTPDAKGNTWFQTDSALDPEHILVSQNKRCGRCFDLYKTNLKSGEDKLLARSGNAVVQWITDRKGNLKGRIRADWDNELELEICDSQRLNWRSLGTWGPKEDIQYVGLTPDERGFWLLSNRGRDRISLVRFDIETRTETLVCEDPVADIHHVTIGPTTGKALFAYADPDYPRTYILDAQLENDLAVLKGGLQDGIQILGMDNKEQLWTVKVFNDKGEHFFLYDRVKQQKQLLGHKQWAMDQQVLARIEPVTFQSRDGLTLRGYLTRPTGTTGQAPLPMVLLVHGGPWARDDWEPNSMVQFLANRGYVVLQVNYRGSSGYGRKFKDAAIHEFARKMHTDLIDAVNWSVDEKIADPDKIAIVGGSYGGYAAMAGLTFTPDVFHCGITINGVSNLADLIESFPSDIPLYRKRGFDMWHEYLGNPKIIENRKDIDLRSPIFFTGQVNKPLLIIYGEQDTRVRPQQSEKMITKLRKGGKNITVRKFETEGHGIQWAHNSERLFQEVEGFLARHLGGRCEE